ncbi:MAG: periplasmic binding protein [Actinomycetia bacterium]|jgi:iron complex transport system substrate-binding protein|nr:periplasmic binding protein [Actinomycetes bacterium]
MIHRTVGGIVAILLLLASCGEPTTPQASPETPRPGSAFPVTIAAANGDVTLERRPERIVSLSPTATEMLFGIGAGEQIEAVDDQSNFPAEAPQTDLSGFEPNVEAIVSYEPDLVVYATEPGDLGSSLEGLGIPTLQQDAPATLEDVYDQIDQLGMATGNTTEAAELVEEMRGDIDAIVESIETPDPPLSFYHELDDTYYSVTSSTFIGQLYSLVGLRNIADEAKGAGGGYPQLSAEYIIEADPDLIFLADTKCCGQSPRTVSERPGWARIDAVVHGGVIPLNDDVASRWGPRVVDYLRRIAAAVESVPEMSAA